MVVRLLVGDCRVTLGDLEPGSVQAAVTSVPYYQLRSYLAADDPLKPFEIGLEKTPELWLEHLVDVFGKVRRVLRDDGCLFVNCGDSYAGSGNGAHDYRDRATSTSLSLNPEKYQGQKPLQRVGPQEHSEGHGRVVGYRPKSLMMMPSRLAMALQADGWILRSMMPWIKYSAMPESCRDRPSTAVEYWFLFSKGPRYFWDPDAVRVQPTAWYGDKPDDYEGKAFNWTNAVGGIRTKDKWSNPAGRNMRNSDLFTTSWQGLMTDESDDPLALVVNPAGYAGSHFACVDVETEALTPNGWRRHDELKDGDVIAAYNQNRLSVQWEQATFHRYPYTGDLVAIEKRDTSQRLTPNHRCLVRRRDGVPTVVLADQLKPGMDVLVAAEWLIDEAPIIGTDWAKLTGWFIAEGESRYPGAVRIYQSMSANPQHVGRINALLDRLGADFKRYERHRDWRGRDSHEITFAIRGAVARRLQALSPDKRLSPELAMCSRADAEALLGALIDGDGHRRADGRVCIIQKDRQSIDAMQMLALRCGYRAQLSPHGNCYTLYLTRGDWLTLRGTNGAHIPIGREHYEGVVWCPSIPSTFWLARRNGKPFITGNTFPPKLIEPLIKASTSEKGACPTCGAPWVRVTDKDESLAAASRGQADYQSRRMEAGNRFASVTPGYTSSAVTTGWRPSCGHSEALTPRPCVVLDPFAGACTTLLVASRLGRDAIGCELSRSYTSMGFDRLESDSPLFFDGVVSGVETGVSPSGESFEVAG